MTKLIDYDEHQWAVYEKARGLSPDRARLWADAGMREAAGREADPAPVVEQVDLVALRRC